MARTAEANQRLREAQRTKILESARKVFARKGMATTMADVAGEASVSQGLAYRYFANKQALFHALVEQAMQARSTSMLEMEGTPGKRLVCLVSRMLEARCERPAFFQLLDQVLGNETTREDLREQAYRQRQVFLDLLRQLIVEGQATGEVTAGDPDQLTITVAACLEGLPRVALHNLEHLQKHCPDARMILQILKPH